MQMPSHLVATMVSSKLDTYNGPKCLLLRMMQLCLLMVLIDLAQRQVVSGKELPECKELNVLKPPRFGKRDAYINRYQENKCINRRRRLVAFSQLKPYLILNWALLRNSRTPTSAGLLSMVKQLPPVMTNQEINELARDQTKDFFIERLKMLSKLRNDNMATETEPFGSVSEESTATPTSDNKGLKQSSDDSPGQTVSYWHRIQMQQT